MGNVEINNNIEALKIRTVEHNTISYISAIFNKPLKYDFRYNAKIIEAEGNDELFILTEEPESGNRYHVGYRDVTFKEDVSISNLNRCVAEILFTDCHFESTLTIDMDSDLQDSVTMYKFVNCTFANTVIIQNIHITSKAYNSNFTFERCIFENRVYLNSCKISIIYSKINSTVISSTNLSIHDSAITRLVLKPTTSNTEQYKVKILKSTVADISTPSSSICNPKQVNKGDSLYAIVGGDISMAGTNGYNKCCLYNVKVANKIQWAYDNLMDIYIDSCTFNDSVIFLERKFGNVQINECVFEHKFWISDSELHNISLTNCRFKDTVKIYNINNPIESASFELSTIEGLFLFNGWDERLLFAKDSTISFSNVFVGVNGYLIIRSAGNISTNKNKQNSGCFDFTNSNILGVVVFNDIYAKSLDLGGASIIGSFNADNIHIDSDLNRDTCLKLKNEFIKKQDGINTALYRVKELIAYDKELKWKNTSDWQQKILLYLNRKSSKHDQSWIRACLFTIGIALFFYSLFYVSVNYRTLVWFGNPCSWVMFDGNYYMDVASFPWILDTGVISRLANDASIGFLSLLIYIIGKISVGYGIYQTVSAFRKFGKK